ncbi:MAG TPA: alpha/beta hydrolase family protein [Anaerolineaceae bacterium]
MALLHADFFSNALNLSTSMDVILPQPGVKELIRTKGRLRRRFPTLYLLHGFSDDHTIWQRRTSIERYASVYNLAVVMPAVHHSFYTDMACGYHYWTFVSEELPALARSFFPLSDKREENYVAGLSMGGYGAFKLGLSHPDRFYAAASLSGALDIVREMQNPDPDWQIEMRAIFGDVDSVEDGPNDLFNLARRVAASEGPRPHLYQACGTEDFLYKANLSFKGLAEELELDLTYSEEPATHEWGYWDRQIVQVLEWLPLEKARTP